MKKHLFKILLLIFSVSIVVSCSTKKNRLTSRSYHNLTAHYNTYFNGKESYKEGVANIDEAFVDDYTKILPLLKFPNDELAKAQYPQMDRAIKKATIVISRHSMLIKGVEYNKWIDDCYLLMAKANFMKREFYTANELFRFVIKQYKSNHEKYEAMIWLANSYIQMGKYPEAQEVFNLLDDSKSQKEIPSYLKKHVLISKAQLNILTNNYSRAIEPLTKALELDKKEQIFAKDRIKEHHFIKYKFGKSKRTRFTFVLAQLNEKIEEYQTASVLFEKIVKMNPPYEMAFYAKIRRAKLYDVKSGEGEKIKKDLLKMAKDAKNKDFLDQIYFAMAEMALKEKKQNEAIDYLKLSAKSSTINTYQKSISFLKLGELYFEMPEYVESQKYYDSTMTYLPKTYPDYASILAKKNILTELATHVTTIQLEDSLQRLAKMKPAEREAVVNKIIQKVIEEEEMRKRQELLNQQMLSNIPQTNLSQNAGGTGDWYFYNPATINFGKQEFLKKWGPRRLEDNWRRANKEIVADFGDVAADTSADSAATVKAPVVNLKDKNTYLKNIPLTKERIDESNKRIEEALYSLARLYKESLNDYARSNETYEELLRRFPETKHHMITCYRLYRNYIELKNPGKTEFYKNIILSKYPDSEYAAIIRNPESARASKTEENKASLFYKETYNAYTAKNYKQVIKNKVLADTLYKGSDFLPRYHYLAALSTGKIGDKKAFEKELKIIVAKYPTNDVAKEATSILNYMARNSDSAKSVAVAKAQENAQIYKPNPKSIHLYCIIVSVMDADINKLKVGLSNFNNTYFSLENLQVNTLYLDNQNQLVTIANFADKDKAMNYFKTIGQQKPFKDIIKNNKFSSFVISTDNYTTFYKQKDVDEYLKFFEANY